MSTPSKKRRKAREWMQNESARHAAEERRLRTQCETKVACAERLVQEERAKYEELVPANHDDVIFPLGKPEHHTIFIAGRADPWNSPMIVDRADPNYWMHARMGMRRRFRLQVEQRALRLPDGTTVIWYELRRAS